VSLRIRVRANASTMLDARAATYISPLQSWTGPPEPFVRWHPFVVNGELVWRGTFALYGMRVLFFSALSSYSFPQEVALLFIKSFNFSSSFSCVFFLS
jgi:hypothetical protein